VTKPALGVRVRRAVSRALLVVGGVVTLVCVLLPIACWRDDMAIERNLGQAVAQVDSVSFNRTVVRYATPGTAALADNFELYLEHHDAFLMANHGATTLGRTLELAHQRMESLEHAARIILTARLLGRVNQLSVADVEALRASREEQG